MEKLLIDNDKIEDLASAMIRTLQHTEGLLKDSHRGEDQRAVMSIAVLQAAFNVKVAGSGLCTCSECLGEYETLAHSITNAVVQRYHRENGGK